MRRKSRLVRTQSGKVTGPVEVSVDSLIQGVSQQPPHLRLVGQGEEQINGWSSPVEGLCKRNPMRLVEKFLPTAVTDFYLQMMNVVSGERYGMMLYPDGSNTKLEVGITGTAPAVDVHGPGLSVSGNVVTATSSSYIHNAAGDYQKKYVLINNGPLGLLLNRQQTVAMDAATSPAPANEALIFVQGVAYDISYILTLDGTALAPVTTPAATATNNQLSTSTVASELKAKIDAVGGYTTTIDRHVVHVRKTDNSDFTLTIDDGRGNSLARIVKEQVTSTAELPTIATNGFVIKVSSDPSQTADDRYLKFSTVGGITMGNGSWAETLQPGIQYKLDSNTMPLVIYRAAAGVIFVGPADGAQRSQTVGGQTYTYTFPQWAERTAGDLVTVPNPEFVGKAVKDHTIFRGRYVFAAGQSVVFSETDDIFNFFQDSSVALTAKDTFSVLATAEISSELNWLLPFDESILVFSQYAQFQVKPADADVLTALTAIIVRLSNLEMNPDVRPKLAGPQVLFATKEFGYTHFREYNFTENTQRRVGLNLGGSNDICTLIPKYIEGLVTHWDVGETVDLMACVTPADTKTIYVYKYLFGASEQGVSKQQASWSKYTFNGDVRWIGFLDNEMYLVLTYADGTSLVRIVSDELEVPGSEQVHLDRLLLYPECNSGPEQVSASYDATTRRTTFTLPYQIQGQARAVVRFTNDVNEGLLLGSATSGNQIVCDAKGDYTSAKVAFGEEYQFTYEFTKFYVPDRDQARKRIVGKQDGRTQILHLTTYHHNTGAYRIRVKRFNRELDSVHEYRSRRPNVLNNRLDTETSHLDSGWFRVPIYSENTACRIMVESTSWLPVTITGASWEGAYSNRAEGAN